jgi:hypothetical protein
MIFFYAMRDKIGISWQGEASSFKKSKSLLPKGHWQGYFVKEKRKRGEGRY